MGINKAYIAGFIDGNGSIGFEGRGAKDIAMIILRNLKERADKKETRSLNNKMGYW